MDAATQKIKMALYEKCAASHMGAMLDQSEMFALKVIPNDSLETLMACINALMIERLLSLFTRDGAPCWRINARDNNAKYQAMSSDEALIYTCIENAARSGLWTRALKERTNLHQSVITRSLKSLENRGLIKPVLNVKQPTQKVYMVSSLAPLEEMTGGPWYTSAGELDEEFIRCIASIAHRFVWSRSFVSEPAGGRKEKSAAGVSRKRKSEGAVEEEAKRERERIMRQRKVGSQTEGGSNLLPMPPGYKGYPRINEIKRHLNGIGITDVTLDDTAVETLMDVLCYDGKVERVLDGAAFRAVKTRGSGGTSGDTAVKLGADVAHEVEVGAGNAFTEAPCGRCPVFDLCEEGGPISASNCEYFEKWLES